MERKQVRLKISRKKLESMTKEEVFQYIRDEQDKYKDARREARLKKAKEGKFFTSNTNSWAVMVPLGLGIGIIIAIITFFVIDYFVDDYELAALVPTEFIVSDAHDSQQVIEGEAYMAAKKNWDEGNFSEMPRYIDMVNAELSEEPELVAYFNIRKLESYALIGEFDIAIAYAQTLQIMYRASTEHMRDILWYRAYAHYQNEQYYEAFRNYQRISQLGGGRAEEAHRNALHIYESRL